MNILIIMKAFKNIIYLLLLQNYLRGAHFLDCNKLSTKSLLKLLILNPPVVILIHLASALDRTSNIMMN